jgi:hypothetical protein
MEPMSRMKKIVACALLLFIVCIWQIAAGQQLSMDPVDLVRRATQNEIAHSGATKPPYFMYRDNTQWKDHSVTTLNIETSEGGLSRTIAKNGKALTPDEQAQADEKLKKYAYDSEARRKKRQSNREDDQRANTLMRSLPDAFTYTVLGVSNGPNGHKLVRLKFVAKPDWSAPTRETRVLEGMQGDIVVDETASRIAEINGTLFKDVDFGWGILGRLDKGGRFIIKQSEVGDGKWEQTEETLQFNGKVLMLKPLNIWSTETLTDFRPVPTNVTTAQALQLLQKGDEVVAENGGAAEKGNNKK